MPSAEPAGTHGQSMQRLANYSFEWVLPGHGRRFHGDRATMQQQMQQCIAWMQQQ